MEVALATIAFCALLVLGGAGFAWGVHVLVRPRDLQARSATALRELEPRGGRHRIHVRLVELIVLASVFASGTGAVLALAGAAAPIGLPVVVGGLSLWLSLWWAWRRGSLRDLADEDSA
jgi:hypothetical protein